MAEDISKYSFDFQKEVDALRLSLGSRADNILFINVDVDQPGGGAPPQIRLPFVVAGSLISGNDLLEMCEFTIRHYTEQPECSSANLPIDTSNNAGQAVFIKNNDFSSQELGEENKPAQQLFALYHETGHALIPDGPHVDNDHPFQEYTADAYAALRFFQRFGQSAAPFLSMMSWSRSFDAIGNKDTSHLTTLVLDKIIADSSHRDFSRLTSAETLDLAKTYVQEWMPATSVLAAMRTVFAPAVEDGVLDCSLLGKTCLASHNDFAFYIGAKFFQPFLAPEGIVWSGETFHLKDEDRQQYAALIEQRAAGLHLQDIFNGVAPQQKEMQPSLIEMLKVTRPAGQKTFIVNSAG